MAEGSSDQTLSHQRDSVSTWESLIEYGLNLEASDVISGILSAKKIDTDIFQPLKYLTNQKFDINLPYNNRSLLMVAAQFGDQACVRLLLDNGANIDWRDKDGESAVFKAAASKNFENANLLLDKGADISGKGWGERSFLHYCLNSPGTLRKSLSRLSDPNVQNISGWAPIHSAVNSSNLEAIRILAEFKADLNIEIREGNMLTPLRFALEEGEMDVVRCLLDVGADVNHRDSQSATALHYARSADAVNILLQRGAEVNATTHEGITPLHNRLHFLAGPNMPIIKKLVKAGANVNAMCCNGTTPLMLSVMAGCGPKAAYLLSKGADPNTSDLSSKSAFYWACSNGDGRMARLLHAAGAKVDLSISGPHPNSLQNAIASRASDHQLLSLFRFLVEDMKVDVNQIAGPLETVVHLACRRDNSRVLEYLINERKCNAMLEVSDESGRLPIHIAAMHSFNSVQYLRSHGCDIHAIDRAGRNILHYAAICGDDDIINRILKLPGIEIDAVDNDGWTALCWAVRATNRWRQVSIVRLLLEKGASKSVRAKYDGCEDWTPLEIAHLYDAENGVVRLLEGNCANDKTQNMLKIFQKREDCRTRVNCKFCDLIF
ncbi:ankyrin repeat protein [Trichoderma chlorosporum]